MGVSNARATRVLECHKWNATGQMLGEDDPATMPATLALVSVDLLNPPKMVPPGFHLMTPRRATLQLQDGRLTQRLASARAL